MVLCAGTAQARQEHVVQRGGPHSTDQQPRLKPPRGLTIVAAEKTSLTIRWQAVRHALKYEVYRSGRRLMSVKRPSATLRRLACGTGYVIRVDAVDRAGRRSPKAAIASATRKPARIPPPTWFVSAAGSDSSRCSRSAPCRSFNRAYHSARPGDVVQVEGGTYSQQDITADSSKSSSADVVFVPEPGNVVTIGCHTLGAVDGTVLAGASCIDESASPHITFDGGPNKGFRSARIERQGFLIPGPLRRGARGKGHHLHQHGCWLVRDRLEPDDDQPQRHRPLGRSPQQPPGSRSVTGTCGRTTSSTTSRNQERRPSGLYKRLEEGYNNRCLLLFPT